MATQPERNMTETPPSATGEQGSTGTPAVGNTPEQGINQAGGGSRWGWLRRTLGPETPAGQPAAQQSAPVSGENPIVNTPSKLHLYKTPDFDPNREDYQTRTIGKDVIFIDPLTGTEVARMPKIEGGAGVLPPTEFASFDPSIYAGDAKLNRIAVQIKTTGDAGKVDEVFLSRIAARIEGLVDQELVDGILAQAILNNLDSWRINTMEPSAAPEPESVEPSYFQKLVTYIEDLERKEQSRTLPTQENNYLVEARHRRDELLSEANNQGWFSPLKESLSGVYYGARVKVGLKERDGKDDYEGRGMLQRLALIQEAVQDSTAIERGSSDRTLQLLQQTHKIFLGEERSRFWSDPQHPERGTLEGTYRGVVDYFNRESINMIVNAVKDRKGATSRENGLYGVWNVVVKDSTGRVLKDEEGKEIPEATNFDDVREAIEQARLQEPWIPNRGDYETWIQFVAWDAEELEEMIPYIVAKVGRKLGTGEPNSVYQTLTQEKEKMDKAMAAFPIESESQFRRLKSALTANLNLMGAHFFSDLVRKDYQPYMHFMEFLASACQDTDYQDHFVDSALLDKEGLTLLALELYSRNDGEFWRYGRKSADTHKKADNIGALLQWQQEKRKKFEEILIGKKLKSMRDLLALNAQESSIHPAFQRLKDKLAALDAEDPQRSNTGFKKRWQEYCEKALRWEESGEFGDIRDRSQRVVFQHPLARAFRPKGFVDEQGNTTQQDEFEMMFESDTRNDRGYLSTKTRKVRSTLVKAERIARAFVQDSASALAWHYFSSPQLLTEAQKYVDIGSSDEAVAHKTLLRGMLQAAMREDRHRESPEHSRFKLHSLLTGKLGLDIDSPLFGAWYLGSHDTLRPGLLRYLYQVPEFTQILDRNAARRGRKAKLADGRDDPTAADEKTTIARWAEDERRFIICMEYVLKRKFPNYFNFPGHDTPGAGVKDIRNAMLPAYGTSTDTVELNSLINEQWVGEGEYGKDYGCTVSPWRQLVGLFKGSDEVVFRETGGFIENPRDSESWVKRFNGIIDEYKIWTKGEKDSHGLLNDAPISGAYHLRARERNTQNYDESKLQEALELATKNPEKAYKELLEGAYEGYVETAAKFIGPLMAVMHHRLSSVESTYGRNPGSAMFLNTLLWYGISRWMDECPEEFRLKFGFAYEADLPLARMFIHTVLYENRLIYNDTQWDENMLGYVRVEQGGEIKNRIRYQVGADGSIRDKDGKEMFQVSADHNIKDNKGAPLYRSPDRNGDIKNGQGEIVYRVDPDNPQMIRDSQGGKLSINQIIFGEIHEGIIDAFPTPDLRKKIIEERWLPFGLTSDKPETLKVLTDHYVKEGSDRTKALYANAYKNASSLSGKRKTIVRP